jgi:hypothetical protein
MRDQLVAKAATYTAHNIHPYIQRDLNPRSQQLSDTRLTALYRTATGIGPYVNYKHHCLFYHSVIMFQKTFSTTDSKSNRVINNWELVIFWE